MIKFDNPKLSAVIAELTEQRNSALDLCAVMRGDIVEKENLIASMSAQLLKLQQAAPKGRTLKSVTNDKPAA